MKEKGKQNKEKKRKLLNNMVEERHLGKELE